MDGSTSELLARYVNGSGIDERLVYWEFDTNTGAATEISYYAANHQGSVVAMVDAGTGAASSPYLYDAYGNLASSQTGQPFLYTGRRWDAEAQLYYYRARYYSAELGRFLQTDPIGYEDNMNLYGYTNNDPVNNTDPSGKWCIPCIPPAIAAIGEGIGWVAAGVAAIMIAEDISETINNNDSDTLPDYIYDQKAPGQRAPAGGKTIEWGRFNTKTGEYEESTVEYDEYGRQVKREDRTDHGYPLDHENPHEHEYEYGPGYGPNGKETRSDKKDPQKDPKKDPEKEHEQGS